MENQSLRHALMHGTRDLHAILDQGMGDFGTVAGYRHYLRGSFAFRAALEPALDAGQGWQAQPLTALLRDDLADLGLQPPPVPAMPRLHGPADVAAALYVVEGSAIGARVLIRRAQALGFDAGHGARHLAAQTGDKQRWPGFLAWLEQSGAAPDDAVRAARRVFGLALEAYGVAVRT